MGNSEIRPTRLSKRRLGAVDPINPQNPRIALFEILDRRTHGDKYEKKEDESEKKSEKSEKKEEKSEKKFDKYEKKSDKYEKKEEKSEKKFDKYEKKEESEKNPAKSRNPIKNPEKYRRHRAETLATPDLRGPPEISARKRVLELTRSNSGATQVITSARKRLLELTKSESRNVLDPSGFGPKSSNSGQESVSSQDFNPKKPSLDSREASLEKKDSREASLEKKDKKDAEEKRAKRTPMKGKGKGEGKGKGKGKGKR